MADQQLEERRVEVNDPSLSPEVNERLTAAVRETLGTDCVRVPADRPHVSLGERAPTTFLQRINSTETMVIGMLAVAICVGLVVALTGGHWWLTGVAVAVLVVALGVVTRTIIALASTTDYPGPDTVAFLSEQGIHNPEVRFSQLVAEFTPPVQDGDRTTAVEEDVPRATAEQHEAVTPTGGPSTAVGPDGRG